MKRTSLGLVPACWLAVLSAAGCGADHQLLGTETTVVDGETVYVAEPARCDDEAACERGLYVDEELFVERCLPGDPVAGTPRAILDGDLVFEVEGSDGTQLIGQNAPSGSPSECTLRWVSLIPAPADE